ncbi:sugar phosphate nucleotidyltransferase [bacterium]|nr:sugar phosphate nucleotidyltransferase [bacterium]
MVMLPLDAVLLCGGKGERLRPLTEFLPKPLVPIKGKPILSYLLNYLSTSPIKRYFIAAGYEVQKIHEYFSAHPLEDKRVTIVDSGDVDIIERIISCVKSIEGEGFLVLYGDTLSDININKLLKFHVGHNGSATVTLWPLSSPFGVMEVAEGGLVESYVEKPVLDKWINIGFFYFSVELIPRMKKFKKFEDFIKNLTSEKELYAYKHTGMHITVNTQKELNEAEKSIELLKGSHE